MQGRRWAAFFRRLFLALLLLIGMAWLADKIWPLPTAEGKLARIVLAEDGTPLWRFPDEQGIWRYPVKLNEVSPLYLQALLGYEDRWFYHHLGLNPFSIIRAAWQNLSHHRIVSGGSTITMQVARLIEPHERTFGGKLVEAWRTLQLEWHYSKDEILQIYLNRAPFGGTQEGIAAASWSYLGKPPAELTHAEAALLAVLPQSPSRLRPDRYPERAQKARDKVLNRLLNFGIWSAQDITEAKEEMLWLPPRQVPQLAPLLAQRMKNESNERLIHTTIDASLQSRLEETVKGWRHQLPERTSIAILVTESKSMAVKAYLGSTGLEDTDRHGFVDMVSAIRSPGSTLKPFLYAMAMDDGLIHSESLLQDIPRQTEQYQPGNFSQGFSGPVSASDALHRSLNLPAVQLLEAYGPKRFVAQLRNGGMTLQFPDFAQPNLSLILGGVGTSLESLVQSYSVFARAGKMAQLRFTPETPLQERAIISAGAAWITRLILTGEWQPGNTTEWSRHWPLAYKTGTSYGFRDAWAVGVNDRYLIGIWIGRPDGTPVAGQFGAGVAVPLLQMVDSLLLAQNTVQTDAALPMPKPNSVSTTTICWPSGQVLPLTDKNCRQPRKAWIIDKATPPTLRSSEQTMSEMQQLTVWLNSKGQRVRPECAHATQQELHLWPAILEPWLSVQEWRENRLPPISIDCPVAEAQMQNQILISGIKTGSTIRKPIDKPLIMAVKASGGRGIHYWFSDQNLAGTTRNNQALRIQINSVGSHHISVIDDNGLFNKISFSVE
nr:peptidoglycan glycosyltransferase PbpC [uncultured Tolumonas sp.]